MVKKILIRSLNCCAPAHLSHSIYQQLKMDSDFNNIEIVRETNENWFLDIHIDDKLFYDEDDRINTGKPFKQVPLPADVVNLIRERL